MTRGKPKIGVNDGWFTKGLTPWNKGKKIRTNTGRTHFKKGNVPWTTGRKLPKEMVENMSGEKSSNWKGDNVKDRGLHTWCRKKFGVPFGAIHTCEKCKKEVKKIDLANKTGIYNRERKNWFFLCRLCHVRYDRKRKAAYDAGNDPEPLNNNQE